MMKHERRNRWSRGLACSFAVAITLVLSGTANAQILSRGDLFGPGAPPPMAGVEVGFGNHTEQGQIDCNCGANFTGGTGTGLLGSIFFELPLDYEWAIGLKGGIDFKNLSTSATVYENVVVLPPDQSQTDTFPMYVTRNGKVKATYLNLAPYAQYQFFRMGPFLQAGIDVGFLLASSLTQSRQLITTSATLSNGTTVDNLTFTNGTLSEDVPQTSTGFTGLRLGVLLSAGYNIQVSERSVFAPLLTYDFPITTSGNTGGSAWKIGSLYGSVELKFKLD